MKSSTYYFDMKTKILPDFQICISVPLNIIHSMGNLLERGNCIISVALWAWVAVLFCCDRLFLIWCLACKNKLNFVFLLKIFTNLWFGGKCLLINLMNILPILVLTDLLYGGLYLIIKRFLFFWFWLFSFDCWYCSLVLYQLYSSTFFIVNDSWKISLHDDKIENFFSIDRGISLMIDGWWSELMRI